METLDLLYLISSPLIGIGVVALYFIGVIAVIRIVAAICDALRDTRERPE